MIKGPKKSVCVLLPLERYERLCELARDCDRTVPGYIRQVLFAYLRRLDQLGSQSDDWWVVK